VQIQVENPDALMRIGMFATASIHGHRKRDSWDTATKKSIRFGASYSGCRGNGPQFAPAETSLFRTAFSVPGRVENEVEVTKTGKSGLNPFQLLKGVPASAYVNSSQIQSLPLCAFGSQFDYWIVRTMVAEAVLADEVSVPVIVKV